MADDAWDPLADPDGRNALKTAHEALTESEKRALIVAARGQKLREVEIDRLVSLKLIRRDLNTGLPELTDLGRETVRALGG